MTEKPRYEELEKKIQEIEHSNETDFAQARAALNQSQERYRSMMEFIGTQTDGFAHDFNNILHMIFGNAELALEDLPKGTLVHKNLEEIKSASLKAADIVKQLLNFTGRTDRKLKPISAAILIEGALNFLQPTIPATIKIQKHMNDMDMMILADPIQINQALMKICTNTSQAMGKTGGILTVSVERASFSEENIKDFPDLAVGEYAKISFSDNGPGIDQQMINRIFDPHFTTSETEKNSGLGLSIVHGIVKNHGGAIFVDSEMGKGTTFNLFFPITAVTTENKKEVPPEFFLGRERILFVDDEKSIVFMAKRMLERLGYKVETSMNPVQALDLFKSKPDLFDLVVTDMTMPQMTGVKLFENLRQIRPDISVILCTGHSPMINEEKAQQLGFAAYIMKPASTKRIAKTIRKVLDR
ncbi:response regulator [Desulfobacula sp.]